MSNLITRQVSNHVSDGKALALKWDRGVRALLASPTERAFESGRFLNKIYDSGHFLALGFDSFSSYVDNLESAKIKPATAYANMKVAKKFDRTNHGHLGIGRLRLLAADHITDPFLLIEQGIPVQDGEGGQVFRSVSEIPCKELGGLLSAMCPAPKMKRGPKKAVPTDTALKNQTIEAAGILLTHSSGETLSATNVHDTMTTVVELGPNLIEAQDVVPSTNESVPVAETHLNMPFEEVTEIALEPSATAIEEEAGSRGAANVPESLEGGFDDARFHDAEENFVDEPSNDVEPAAWSEPERRDREAHAALRTRHAS